MAIFGIGAFYDHDVWSDFLERGCACIGWSQDDAPPAHGILGLLRAGDIVFIKSFTPNEGLTIKAVGIVSHGEVQRFGALGRGVPVRWVWTGEDRIGRLNGKWPVRTVTIYEEHHPRVQERVLEHLLENLE